MKRNSTVDIMKMLAIVMVVACHTGQRIKDFPFYFEALLKIGQLGVQIFFVMTAYLCCVTSRKYNYQTYVGKKYFRLAPTYYFGIIMYVTLFVVITALSLPVRIYTNNNLYDVLINFTLLNNFIPSACNSVVPGGWSISCIWIFFLTFPFLFKILNDNKRKWIWLSIVFQIVIMVLL